MLRIDDVTLPFWDYVVKTTFEEIWEYSYELNKILDSAWWQRIESICRTSYQYKYIFLLQPALWPILNHSRIFFALFYMNTPPCRFYVKKFLSERKTKNKTWGKKFQFSVVQRRFFPKILICGLPIMSQEIRSQESMYWRRTVRGKKDVRPGKFEHG